MADFIKIPERARDLAGQRFGRLLVLGAVPRPEGMKITSYFAWLCRCDCNTQKVISASKLNEGSARSCGCLKREASWEHVGNRIHGESASAEYSSWKGMIRRCTNPNFKQYKDYGGNGITVCERWRKFEPFLADMGKRPTPKHSIDRIENSKGYEPGNCRWATRREQSFNRRCAFTVTAFGKTTSLAAFFENSKGRDYDRAHHRIKTGWDPESAILAAPHSLPRR